MKLSLPSKLLATLAVAAMAGLSPAIATAHSVERGSPPDSTVVSQWSAIAAHAVEQFDATCGCPGVAPKDESRAYAMAFTAMHDALNAIDRRFHPYLSDLSLPQADPNAAVAKAVHDVMIAQLPTQLGFLDSQLALTLAAIPNGAHKRLGIALGQQTARAILEARANDGSTTAQGPYNAPATPGVYQPTFPVGVATYTLWGNVTPFALRSATQFRAPPNYKVTDAQYTIDFNEVKDIGGMVSALRTADQSQIAKFWLESSPLGWLRIARNLADGRHLNGWDKARLYALLEIAIADSYIEVLNDKYFYRFWRPITAITLADTDGNPNTAGDPNWLPFDIVTPPVPDYPSAHSDAGGAAESILRRFFRSNRIGFSTTSGSLPGVTRHFVSFSAAAKENADSRVFVGYHFRNATVQGRAQGKRIGRYVMRTQLKRVDGDDHDGDEDRDDHDGDDRDD